MSSTFLLVFAALSIGLFTGLTACLLLLNDSQKKLQRTISDTNALQRMITTHGDSQLQTDGRMNQIERQLEKLQTKTLQVQSFIAGITSIENATSLIENSGVTDVERLAIQSGLTEREAALMVRLRKSYSTDTVSAPDGAK